jgi:hypothetical protein
MSLIGLLNYFDQKRGQEQYGQLLNEYRVPGDPNALPLGNTPQELDQSIMQQQGGFRGAGGPPQEFYMRAAALPGYQQLAQQAFVGQQAMERQMQGQQWEANNMSLAQKTQLDMNAQQQQWQRQRQEFEWNNPSAYQQASIEQDRARTGIAAGHLGLAQQQFGLQQQQFGLQQQQAQLERQFPALALKGNDAIKYRDRLAQLDKAAAISTDVVDWLGNAQLGANVFSRGDVKSMQSAFQTDVIPYFQQKFEAGALQAADLELIKNVMGDPGSWTSLNANQKAKVASLLTQIQDDRDRTYGMGGMRAPEIKPGSSAWARSARSGNTGRAAELPPDIQWGP